MKYIRQFCIIMGISFLGEGLRYLIPLQIPASIYGLVILFLCLQFKLIALSSVRETGYFLIEIMPLMFIPATVGLLDAWPSLRPVLLPIISIIVVSTFVVMVVSGRVTQLAMRTETKENGTK